MAILANQLDCVLQLFPGPPHVVTVTNALSHSIVVVLELSAASRLFDRSGAGELVPNSSRVAVRLGGWQAVALELRVQGILSSMPLRIDSVFDGSVFDVPER